VHSQTSSPVPANPDPRVDEAVPTNACGCYRRSGISPRVGPWLVAPGMRVGGLYRLTVPGIALKPADRDDSAAQITSIVTTAYLRSGGGLTWSRWPQTTGAFRYGDVTLIAKLTPPAASDGTPQGDHTRRLIRLLKHWNTTAADARAPSLWFSMPIIVPRQTAPEVASRAIRAALDARDRVVHDDPTDSREAVAGYVSKWLGLRPTPAIVEAAGNALLQAPLEPDDTAPERDVIQRLHSEIVRQRRAWRPIGETQLGGRRVDSLQRTLNPAADTTTIVADTVAIEDLHTVHGGWDDDRLTRVLNMLRPDERHVALAYAHDGGTTWSGAARACGLPDPFGERVRRKLLRLGRQLTSRITASPPRPRPA